MNLRPAFIFCYILLTGTVSLYGQAGPVSITPNAGVGSSQTFTFVYSDPLGGGNISLIQVLFNDSASSNICYLVWDLAKHVARLNSDTGWTSNVTTAPQPLIGSQC